MNTKTPHATDCLCMKCSNKRSVAKKEKANADYAGWVNFKVGDPTPHPDTLVLVEFRSGEATAGSVPVSTFGWGELQTSTIVRYKVVEPVTIGEDWNLYDGKEPPLADPTLVKVVYSDNGDCVVEHAVSVDWGNVRKWKLYDAADAAVVAEPMTDGKRETDLKVGHPGNEKSEPGVIPMTVGEKPFTPLETKAETFTRTGLPKEVMISLGIPTRSFSAVADSPNALDTQVGGDHYKECKIQPVEFIEANELGFLEGCIVKRVTRHNKPSGKGRQDIEKVIHECQLLLKLRYPDDIAQDFPGDADLDEEQHC